MNEGHFSTPAGSCDTWGITVFNEAWPRKQDQHWFNVTLGTWSHQQKWLEISRSYEPHYIVWPSHFPPSSSIPPTVHLVLMFLSFEVSNPELHIPTHTNEVQEQCLLVYQHIHEEMLQLFIMWKWFCWPPFFKWVPPPPPPIPLL